MKVTTILRSNTSNKSNSNLSYSESASARDELEWAIGKLSELLDKDSLDIEGSQLNYQGIYEQCMNDKGIIKSR